MTDKTIIPNLLHLFMEGGNKVKVYTTQTTFFGRVLQVHGANTVYLDLGYSKVAINISHIVAVSWR